MSDIRVTEEQINDILEKAKYRVRTEFDKCTVVTCQLPNGFILTESSACVDPANYSKDLGVQICRRAIREKVWLLEGYLLQERQYVERLKEEAEQYAEKLGDALSALYDRGEIKEEGHIIIEKENNENE